MTKSHITFIIVLFLLPTLAIADDYEGYEGLFNFINDFATDIWEFWDTDVPEFITRFFAWFVEYATLIKLKIEFETIKFSWEVSKNIIENFQIGSRITSAASALPNDVRAALVDMRAFDALNVIIQALVTRYVMRFL
ncbi:DUF2523 family protein [Pseudoalteromonas maricaloris]|uniref:DUF2523 family protein n=1 Tax=Pseudoalteromonas maricaloris TaxID=184924 RepID=UPI00057FE237|nr:DUF2523 family protein [Pseudoalteromonas flavipulchra]KID34836.1 phage protein [Pseudoalteromonas flavipulchra NCIMB 2033 = ATCC BAA-314]MBD0784058.1 DUF2523 domain-containing protein [Pseudoalteromonas flavipulchra]MBE0372885.1 hypothetical protein [Pseudoalteromonas flavipulchra NCIMB 2033 = ATCC BAA-314]